MEHIMKLNASTFEDVKSGKKRRKYRLNDEKRKLVRVGDTIRFLKLPNLYEFEQASLLEEMLSGYQDSWNQGCCPTQVYLLGIGRSNVWNGLEFFSPYSSKLMKNVCDKYNLVRRLSLELPVSYDEYTATDELLQGTNKFNI